MPLNNSINKNSDTFYATTNITANSTSPITTTVSIDSTTSTTCLSSSPTSTSTVGLYSESFGSSTNNMIMLNSGGTKASPSDLNASTNNIIFAHRRTTYTEFARIFTKVDTGSTANIRGLTITAGVATDSPTFLNNVAFRIIRQLSSIYIAQGIYNYFPVVLMNLNNRYLDIQNNKTDTKDAYLITYNEENSPEAASRAYTFLHYRGGTGAGVEERYCRIRNTNFNSPTQLQVGDVITTYTYAGLQATGGFSTYGSVGATLQVVVDALAANGTVLNRFVFNTSATANTPTEAMRIDYMGRITQVRQPAFSAYIAADVANATGDGTAYTVAYDTEEYDQGNNFAANTFTAPIAGKYRFNWIASVNNLLVGHTKMTVSVGGRVVFRGNPYAIADSDGYCLVNGSVDLSLAASATVTMVITVTGSTKTVTVKGTTGSGCFLSGQLQV